VLVSGDNSTDSLGKYIKKGSPDPLNIPGARRYAATWVDSSKTSLWMFGGYGLSASPSAGTE
jgi:hypothetical protein